MMATLAFNELIIQLYVILCAIQCHLYNLKSVKNTHGKVLLLGKLQAKLVPFYHHHIKKKLSQKSVTIVMRCF